MAFASHFLTDLFASGHMRTPRLALENSFGYEVGALLSLFQHNEDGDIGLDVVNEREGNDNSWRAYGDGHLFETKSNENRTKALYAVQTVVEEMYQAFNSGKIQPISQSVISTLIPKPIENNHPPLFKVGNKGEMLYRIPLGSLENDYAELTDIKVVEILTYQIEHFIEKSIKERIEHAIKKLKGLVKDDYVSLRPNSIFNKKNDINQVQLPNKSRSCPSCSCSIL